MGHLLPLLAMRLTMVKNVLRRYKQRSPLEALTLALFLLAAGIGLFFFFFHGFKFLRSQEPFGPLLINETFFLFNFTLFLMLFISSAVSAYASLFRSAEVPFLLMRTVSWTDIYFIKLAETLWFSSWSLLFIAVPFMTAFGMIRDTPGFYFPLLCIAFYVPFIVLAGTLGALACTVTVWLLPGKKSRLAALIAGTAAAVFILVHSGPEVIKEQGSFQGVLTGSLPNVAFAKFPLLPSYWLSRGILTLNEVQSFGEPDFKLGMFYLLVLLSNALFFSVPSFSAAGRLFSSSYMKDQDHAEAAASGKWHKPKRWIDWHDRFHWPSRPAWAFLEKDLKIFARDPSEWSQLIIFFGLLLLYFVNLRSLEFHALKDFWKNIIFILNTLGTYIVLSSFSMRFVFPMLSLEGNKAWILGTAPISFSSLVLEKFLLGTTLSAALTLPLVFLSGWMLQISGGRLLMTTGLGLFVCIALTGLSVGMGARFPNFKSNNPSQIISGFGGSVLLVLHLIYLALIGLLLALSKEHAVVTFAFMGAVSLLAGMISLQIGVRALQKMEF